MRLTLLDAGDHVNLRKIAQRSFAAVCHDFERLDSHLVARLPGHVGELVAIGAPLVTS
jgi:hypothetical protein